MMAEPEEWRPASSSKWPLSPDPQKIASVSKKAIPPRVPYGWRRIPEIKSWWLSFTFEDISEKALHAKPSWIWEQNAENEELKVEESEVTTWPVIIPEESHTESWRLGRASSYPDTRAVKLWGSE